MLKFLFWPISLAGWLLEMMFSIVGGLIGCVIGLAIAGAGVALCSTIVGAIFGIPLTLLGGSIALHSLF